ncbi:MAG: hypothetical protein ACP5LN_11315, partial [Thermoproteota archaeon]
GLINGECDYYITCNGEKCAVYYKDGSKVSEDFSKEDIKRVNKITFNEDLGIVEINTPDSKTITIDFNPVYPFKEEFLDYTKLLNI